MKFLLGKIQEISGPVAQLGERVLCKHEASGSIPLRSTKFCSSFSWTKFVLSRQQSRDATRGKEA